MLVGMKRSYWMEKQQLAYYIVQILKVGDCWLGFIDPENHFLKACMDRTCLASSKHKKPTDMMVQLTVVFVP